ncbi:polysaccharide deacetylase family protein [Paenibacillus sp. HJGM_3]|uniref:polysaccharide deacetylase family protein n=1 Tax=Paenibacillus sp. HJGM_3 TaxID=3379816 RepID=UPI00385C8280
MRKGLILNCDDFGQSAPANAAIMHLLEERKVSSATIMPPAIGFEEAADWCRRKQVDNVGLHLTFTSEYEAVRFSSLTGHPSLHDASGRMPMTVEAFERSAEPRAVRAEIEAQFEAVRKAGIRISHADNHMGSLYGLATGRSYLPQALWACSRRGLPFRLFRYIDSRDQFLASIPGAEQALGKVVALADTLGVAVPDYLLSHPYHVQEGETYDSFKRMLIQKLYDLPKGISETYIHPAVPDPALEAQIPSWEKRVWEYKLMLDDDFAYGLKDAGVTLTDYRYVTVHRKRSRVRSALQLARMLLK